MEDLTSLNFICKSEKYKGFDLQAGKTWIYPTNYPIRDYQLNIVQQALLKNTLVSLPTGLGKTFIAAVVMYNFYRWYPTGKIIFMAPTRPLVKQQIDACYNIMAIPKDTTAELTGSNMQSTRMDIWKEKRVFFVTAQVLSNDLDKIADLGSKIKCLVFDEAHKAKGNYAYCLVIRKLLPKTKNFRVLALSATPGNNISDVKEVVENLLISHIELRTEDSPDVVPYTFKKNMETVVVPIGEKLAEVRNRYIQILEKYTRVLLKHRVIQGNCSNLTKGKIFMTLKEFQERNKTTRCEAYSEIMRNLNICVTLYHGFELLIRHGLRSFLSFFQEHADKPLLRGNMELYDIMQDISKYLGPPPDISPLPNGDTPEIPENTRFGHPKFYKLCDILLAHFTQHHLQSSRVIVFCEYRESVMEAYAILLQQKPLIKPKVFVGQGGITQRQQLNVIQSFMQGNCNTLISTCIGEEGLDVGEVDLIVCFDISNKSPVRMIQRIGRTGRKRDGRVVFLVTEGKEEQTLKACQIQKRYMSKTILGSVELTAKLYKENSRMIPDDIVPECMKIHISVKKEAKIKNDTIKELFSKMEDALTQTVSNKGLNDMLPDSVEYWDKSDPLHLKDFNKNKLNFSKYLEKQRKPQPTGIIHHSKRSELLVSLLQFADSKRFNIPVTQGTYSLSSQLCQVPKEKSKVQKTKDFKQSDLRSMLFKTSTTTELASEETAINKRISDYLQSVARISDVCKVCENFFDCTQLKSRDKPLKINEWNIPDLEALGCINIVSLENFKKALDPFSEELTGLPEDLMEPTEAESEFSKNNSIAFELPKGFDDVVKKCNSTFFENIDFTQLEKDMKSMETSDESFEEVYKFFKLESIKSLFIPSDIEEKCNLNCSKVLNDTIIYVPEQDENLIKNQLSPVLNKTQIGKDEDGSPILCSYERIKFLKNKAQKKIFTEDNVDNQNNLTQVNTKPRLSNLLQKKQNSFYVPKNTGIASEAEKKAILNDSLSEAFNTTFFDKNDSVKIEDIDDIFDTSFFSKSITKHAISESKQIKDTKIDVLADIDDICDISELMKTTNEIVGSKKHTGICNSKEKNNDLMDISDICDISDFIPDNKPKVISKNVEKKKNDINDLLDLDDICNVSLLISKKATLKNKKDLSVVNEDSTKSNVKTSSQKKEYNSEDEFEISTSLKNKLKSSPLVKSNRNKSNRNKPIFESDDDFEMPLSPKIKNKNLQKFKKTKKQQKENPFIEFEAEVSDEEGVIVSDDETIADDDCLNSSFVNDETQVFNNTQMCAVYLQSVKSPTSKNGFKIPKLPKLNRKEIFSQHVVDMDDSYLNDTFCVDSEGFLQQDTEPCELEIAEMILQKKRKRKRQNKADKVKRKRVLRISDDSD